MLPRLWSVSTWLSNTDGQSGSSQIIQWGYLIFSPITSNTELDPLFQYLNTRSVQASIVVDVHAAQAFYPKGLYIFKCALNCRLSKDHNVHVCLSCDVAQCVHRTEEVYDSIVRGQFSVLTYSSWTAKTISRSMDCSDWVSIMKWNSELVSPSWTSVVLHSIWKADKSWEYRLRWNCWGSANSAVVLGLAPPLQYYFSPHYCDTASFQTNKICLCLMCSISKALTMATTVLLFQNGII